MSTYRGGTIHEPERVRRQPDLKVTACLFDKTTGSVHDMDRGYSFLKHLMNRVAAFLKAEEVPRWFGLSLMLIYLIGLATVANVGIQQARRESARTFRESTRFAMELLANDLARSFALIDDEAARRFVFQRELRDFADHTPVRMLRLVDRGEVIYSLDPDEIGAPSTGMQGDGLPAADSAKPSGRRPTRVSRLHDEWLVRVPIQTHHPVLVSPVETEGHATPDDAMAGAEAWPDEVPDRDSSELFLEARISATSPGAGHLSDYAGAFSIVLVVLGAFFVTYRCLREQMRSVSRIAGRLESHRDRIQDELLSLRITDTAGLDGVTRAWNELVELTQSLLDKVERNDADEELMRVLQAGSCNALGDALHVVPDSLLYICDERRIEYANAAACRLMGWNQEQAAGGLIGEVKAEGVGARILALVQESLQSNGTYVPRAEVLEVEEGKNQVASSFRVWVMPVRRQRAQGECVVIVRDVSQQVRAEKAREEFVTQVTHELRTPLTNIRAYAETLSSGMFDDPKVITECYNVIMKETRRLSRLIEDMLSVSQLEVGSINLSLDNVDLKALLTEGVRDVRGLAEDKNIDVQLVLPSKLEPIRADRDKFAVVVNNLLGNAIKYTPRDGNVIVGCQLSGQEVLITVKDNGIGIDPAEHGKVFEKFQRGSNPEVKRETGTGIGLYTAREITRRHGGDIELISEIGGGATFLVRLPHRESRATPKSTQEAAS